MIDVDKEISRLVNSYSKLYLAQMIIERDSSIDVLNGFINKLKCCGNCNRFLTSGICGLDGADIVGEREPCEKWEMTD